MGSTKGFTISGHKQIEKLLKKVPANVHKKTLKKAMRKGLRELHQEVRRLCPVDTGETRKQIKVRAGKRSRTKIEVDIKSKDDNFIPKFLEFGTSTNPAFPFYRPAYDAKGEDAKNKTVEALKELIEDELKKGK